MSDVQIKCPWCGGTLEKGECTASYYGFLRDEAKLPWLPKKDPVWVGDGVVFFFNWSEQPIAYNCPECRRIVIPY